MAVISINKRGFGQWLRNQRKRMHLTQEDLAERLETTVLTINRWEHEKVQPRLYHWGKLREIFGEKIEIFFPQGDAQEKPGEEDADEELPPIWNVPHLRNLYFTGREDTLERLHSAFTSRKHTTQPRIYAISGLGGIGKTQVAIEYAYRHASEYKAVLWARAESDKSLISDFVAFANLPGLPQKDETDQNRVVDAVKHWLRVHPSWLLILDNADNVQHVYTFLPALGDGNILITTRSQAIGPNIKNIELEKLDREEGVLFLLRRSKLLDDSLALEDAPEADRRDAEAMYTVLDGLPLALDQAAAYIEEHDCNLADYLELYQTRREALLQRRGNFSQVDYPRSVAATWSLSFEQVERSEVRAADLLRLCAFLYPDSIPEEMLMAGAAQAGPALQAIENNQLLLNDMLYELRQYSLLRRNCRTRTLTMHRLVQIVLKDIMEPETRRQWAERAVRVVNAAFPDIDFNTCPRCQMYLPHAQTCAELIQQYHFAFPEAARLLHLIGEYYLHERGEYTEAEPYLKQSLALRTQLFGENHLETAAVLNDLGILLFEQGKYQEAESLLTQALAIREQLLGPDHPALVSSLTWLACIYRTLARYEQAEPLLLRALAIREQAFGLIHADVAESINELAVLYNAQKKYEEAEMLLHRSHCILKQVLDSNHPHVARSLNNLAMQYRYQGKYELAEPLMQKALNRLEQALGPEHPHTGTLLNNMAKLYVDQGKYELAEPYLHRSLAIRERAFGSHHPAIANCLNSLGQIYTAQGKYTKAWIFYRRTLAIREKSLGPAHPDVIAAREEYANLLQSIEEANKIIGKPAKDRCSGLCGFPDDPE
jgi:tetratricopeptide (TPR) repeat protein/transcriptional regulator with XRE-family HTH domain